MFHRIRNSEVTWFCLRDKLTKRPMTYRNKILNWRLSFRTQTLSTSLHSRRPTVRLIRKTSKWTGHRTQGKIWYLKKKNTFRKGVSRKNSFRKSKKFTIKSLCSERRKIQNRSNYFGIRNSNQWVQKYELSSLENIQWTDQQNLIFGGRKTINLNEKQTKNWLNRKPTQNSSRRRNSLCEKKLWAKDYSAWKGFGREKHLNFQQNS